jgi:hypothetical protein
MLGRIAYALKAKNHMQETMHAFRQDWTLLEQSRARVRSLNLATLPHSSPHELSSQAEALQKP